MLWFYSLMFTIVLMTFDLFCMEEETNVQLKKDISESALQLQEFIYGNQYQDPFKDVRAYVTQHLANYATEQIVKNIEVPIIHNKDRHCCFNYDDTLKLQYGPTPYIQHLQTKKVITHNLFNLDNVTWHPHKNMVIGNSQEMIELWSVQENSMKREWQIPLQPAASVLMFEWSHDGQKVIISISPNRYRVYDLTGKELVAFETTGDVYWAADNQTFYVVNSKLISHYDPCGEMLTLNVLHGMSVRAVPYIIYKGLIAQINDLQAKQIYLIDLFTKTIKKIIDLSSIVKDEIHKCMMIDEDNFLCETIDSLKLINNTHSIVRKIITKDQDLWHYSCKYNINKIIMMARLTQQYIFQFKSLLEALGYLKTMPCKEAILLAVMLKAKENGQPFALRNEHGDCMGLFKNLPFSIRSILKNTVTRG